MHTTRLVNFYHHNYSSYCEDPLLVLALNKFMGLGFTLRLLFHTKHNRELTTKEHHKVQRMYNEIMKYHRCHI